MGRRRRARNADYQEPRKPFRKRTGFVNPQASSSYGSKSESDVPPDINKDNGCHEIPGYFYDPDNNTYFRITPENSKYFTEKQQKINSRAELIRQDQKTYLNRRRFTNTSLTYGLFQREYNWITCESFYNQVQKTRIKMLKEINRTTLDDSQGIVENCQIMIGNPSQACILGAWRTSMQTTIYNHCLQDTQSDEVCASSIVNILYLHQVADMCRANLRDGLEFVLFVCNPIRPGTVPELNLSTVHLLPIRHYFNDSSFSSRALLSDGLTLTMEFDKLALWSCTWNYSKALMAFGSESLVLVYAVDGIVTNVESFSVTDENIFSLEFDQPGVSLFCGTNKGYLKTFDTRLKKIQSNVKLFRGLSYLKLLESGNQILASCYDHKLLQVDLRMGKVVVEYNGHKNEHLRIPFTFSEKTNFLCSLGQDNQTRFWNLTNGAPVSTLPPPRGTSTFRPWVSYSDEWLFKKNTPESALVMNYGQDIITYK